MSTLSPSSNSTELTSDGTLAAPRERSWGGLPVSAWLQVGVLAALLAAVFWPNLRRLILKTNPFTGEANWGHSIVIPVVGIYYLYVNRDALLAAKIKPAWSGLLIMLFGIGTAAWGIYPGRNDTMWDYGMVITIFGVVLLMCGWEVMKVAWFPIVFLFAAVPFPGLVYSRMAMPLQHIAADVAVFVLQVCGVDAQVKGTNIVMQMGLFQEPRSLNVAEACAGLRSLMTFISLAAAIAFLSNKPLWQKLVLVFSAIPIAIFCNVMRVSVQGLLDYYVSRQISEGFAHKFVGMAMLVPAFFMILGVQWILDRMFVEQATSAPKSKVRRRTRRKPAGQSSPRLQEGVQ